MKGPGDRRGAGKGAPPPHARSCRLLLGLLVVLALLFSASVFSNLSHPLFWADESMTAMQGKRVLAFGYPKVHDGRNVLYDLRHPDRTLGIDARTDAFVGGANWGQYYVAALGVKLAERTSDIYLKTGIVRALFALLGCAGVALVGLTASWFQPDPRSRLAVLAGFSFLELLSVPLALHLREARYYPLTVFALALVVALFARHRILRRGAWAGYLGLQTLALALLFFAFSPAYFIGLLALLLFESIALAQAWHGGGSGAPGTRSPLQDCARGLAPLLLSVVVLAPCMAFFRVFTIAARMEEYNVLSTGVGRLGTYLQNLATIWRFFAISDLIVVALFLKVLILVCRSRWSPLPAPFPPGGSDAVFCGFLTVLFVLYFFAVPRIPNFLFTRYFIPLQPILAAIILLDFATVWRSLAERPSRAAARWQAGLAVVVGGLVILGAVRNADALRGHVFELLHPYRGPLDHIIPSINQAYPETEKLLIAANYEETSYMFYLDARVIVGFVGNNLEEDARALPDIIARRKSWGNFRGVFADYARRAPYRSVVFPVVDTPTNNIPELNWSPPYVHRFRAEPPGDEGEMAAIQVRESPPLE